ncbi:uncharacterized protein LOC132205386 [Neocloeon triangulifer]|uniref:uncharacterized protein LOC132205386 n=1 Tax=Neocloeon triangulifer TaxID=2078957 RepID=UPI00286F293B|nr:uncharacterized protein LOC132205386 [Neocloeon triangulifer]
MCNKTIYYSLPFPNDYERHVYACAGGLIRPSSPWVPKSEEEMKCVISNLPSTFYQAGSLRMFLMKNYCKPSFTYCYLPNGKYVPFNASIVPWAPSNFTAKGNSPTCVRLLFKVKNKNEVHSLQLQEISCLDALNVVCEGLE